MDTKLRCLVDDMGFPMSEAQMALNDCSGNVDLAIERLVSGEYKPPPYSRVAENQPHDIPMPCPSYESTTKNSQPCKDQGLYPSLPFYPPPYSKAGIDDAMKGWEHDASVQFVSLEQLKSVDEDRCSTCFDPVRQSKDDDDRIVRGFMSVYHYACYIKSNGPKCSYCCFSLAKPDKDRELSGQYLIYNDTNYHVECYEKYAGPRCSYCFNVIIERPNGEYTGRWTQDGSKQYHEECYWKKKYSEERARKS